MAFFNPKENVIDIQLTSYGKHLLSLGKFKPTYYSFFDDHVLYDSSHASIVSESQNSIQSRIKEDIQLECQYVFSGIESKIKENNKLLRSGIEERKIQSYADKERSLLFSLGNSSQDNQFSPSYNIKFLNGDMSSSIGYATSSYSTLKIPQLSSSIEYKLFITDSKINDILKIINEDSDNPKEIDKDFVQIREFEDKTNIRIEKDYILLEVLEENTEFQKENFDIEVYMVEDFFDGKISGSMKQEKIIPLYFSKDIINNFSDINSSYVDYFLDISVDGEIDKKFICKAIGKSKSKDLFSDVDIDCSGNDFGKSISIKNVVNRKNKDFEDC